jgi:hypothetical protein
MRNEDVTAAAGAALPPSKPRAGPACAPQTIGTVVNGDSKREADETFFIDLFGSGLNPLLTRGRGGGTILNDD